MTQTRIRHVHSARPRNADPQRTLSVDYLPTTSLLLDPKNPRAHNAKQIQQIASSIKTFGFNVPVLVDAALHVIAGHGRLLACELLGITIVPVIRLEHLS